VIPCAASHDGVLTLRAAQHLREMSGGSVIARGGGVIARGGGGGWDGDALDATFGGPGSVTARLAGGASAADAASLADTMAQLCAAGERLLTRIRDGEAAFDRGYGCGGLGSGLPAGMVAAAGLPAAAGGGGYAGAAEYVMRVAWDGAISPDGAVPAVERNRRAAVRDLRLCVEVQVNGEFVARSDPAPVAWPQWTLYPALTCALRLYRRPTSMAVRVADATGWLRWLLGPVVVATVLLPVPGAGGTDGTGPVGGGGGGETNPFATAALMPVSGAFEFSDARPLEVHPAVTAMAAIAPATVAGVAVGAAAVASPMGTGAGVPGVPGPMGVLQGGLPTSPGGGHSVTVRGNRFLHGFVVASAAWAPNDGSASDMAMPGVVPPADRAPVGGVSGGDVKLHGAPAVFAGMAASAGLPGAPNTAPGGASRSTGHLLTAGDRSAAASVARPGIGSPARPGSRPPSGQNSPARTLRAAAVFGGSAAVVPVAHSTTGLGDAGPSSFLSATAAAATGGGGAGSAGLALELAALRGSTTLTSGSAGGNNAVGAPGAAFDPNDPRAARAARSAATSLVTKAALVGRQFRVTALSDAMLSFKAPLPVHPTAPGFGFGMFGPSSWKTTPGQALPPAATFLLELLPSSALQGGLAADPISAAAALVAPSGAHRLRLLRLRSERPDLFRDVRAPVPLVEAQVLACQPLRDVLHTVPVPAAGADLATGMVAATAWALAGLVHAAMGPGGALAPDALGDGDGDGGKPGVAALLRTKLMTRVKAFLARLQSGPVGASRLRRTVALSSVVKEISLPAQKGTDWSKLLLLLAPRRKLRPLGIDAGAVVAGGVVNPLTLLALRQPTPAATYRINIQLVRARNLPVRRQVEGGDASAGGEDAVLALVEARFQGHVARSATSPGSNPHWNQVISLPFTPPGEGITPALLAQITDDLSLSLFDEQVTETRVDDRDRLSTLVQRDRRFLGSVAIPFFTIYSQEGVHGELKLSLPPVLLGYRAPGIVNTGPSSDAGTAGGAMRVGAPVAPSMGVTAGSPAGPSPMGMPASSGFGYPAAPPPLMPTPGYGGTMPGLGSPSPSAGAGFGGAGVAVEGGALSLMHTAVTNPRSPHIYVHVSIDPPLPVEEGRDEDDDDGAATTTAGGGLAGQTTLRRAILATTRGEAKRDTRRVLEHALAWSHKYGGKRDADGTHTRLVKPLVQTIDGEIALVCRYLVPQLPPPDAIAAWQAATGSGAGGAGTPQRRGSGGSDALAASGAGFPPTTPLRRTASGYPAASPLGGMVSPGRPPLTSRVHTGDSGSQAPGSPAGLTYSALGDEATPVSPQVPRMTSLEALARFVALVPFIPDSQAFAKADTAADIWATTQQTLDMGAGDVEEHAVMLHNYLLWLEAGAGAPGGGPHMAGGVHVAPHGGSDRHTFLAFGRCQPDGDAVFVMRQVRTATALTTLFIDASSGRAFLAEDDTNPLVSVGMVASGHNCWANVQPSSHPWRCSFDLEDARCWVPLFTPARPHPGPDILPPLQGTPVYRAPDVRLAAVLESEIASNLTAQLRSWRSRFVTRIRGDLTAHLRSMLWELEARACGTDGMTSLLSSEGAVTVGGGPGSYGMRSSMGTIAGGAAPGAANAAGAVRDLASDHQAALERLAARYKFQGFPLHATFTDMAAISTMVHATGIHRLDDGRAQYGLAVVVVPYPCGVFSVWVYVLALLPTGGYGTGVVGGGGVATGGESTPGGGAGGASSGWLRGGGMSTRSVGAGAWG